MSFEKRWTIIYEDLRRSYFRLKNRIWYIWDKNLDKFISDSLWNYLVRFTNFELIWSDEIKKEAFRLFSKIEFLISADDSYVTEIFSWIWEVQDNTTKNIRILLNIIKF